MSNVANTWNWNPRTRQIWARDLGISRYAGREFKDLPKTAQRLFADYAEREIFSSRGLHIDWQGLGNLI